MKDVPARSAGIFYARRSSGSDPRYAASLKSLFTALPRDKMMQSRAFQQRRHRRFTARQNDIVSTRYLAVNTFPTKILSETVKPDEFAQLLLEIQRFAQTNRDARGVIGE